MEIEEKGRPQPSGGGEGGYHGGAHVCHRCGWAYPNPHPSAKQRRSHKKHCANAAAAGGDEGAAGERKVSDEELSDEGRRGKKEEAVVEGLGQEKEEERGGLVGSVRNVGGLCTDQLENGKLLEHNADAAAEQEKSSLCSFNKAFSVNGCEVKMNNGSYHVVVDSPIVVSDGVVGDCMENSTAGDMPAAPNLSGEPATQTYAIHSDLCKMDASAEIDALSIHTIAVGPVMKGFSEEVSSPIKERESSSNRLEANAGDIVSNCEVKGNGGETLNVLIMPTVLDKTSASKKVIAEDNESIEVNKSLISSCIESVKEPEYSLEGPELTQTKLVMVQSDRNADDISSLVESYPLNVEMKSGSSISQPTENQTTEVEQDIGERLLINDLKCELKVSAKECEVSEGTEDGTEAHPYAMTGGSSGVECASQEANLYLSHEKTLPNHMVASNVVSILNEGTGLNGSELVVPVKDQITNDNMVEEYRQKSYSGDSSAMDMDKSKNDGSKSRALEQDTGVNSTCTECISQHHSNKLDHQKVLEERFTEATVDRDNNSFINKTEAQIECMQVENSHGKVPDPALDQQEVKIEQFVPITWNNFDETDKQRNLQGQLVESDAGNENDLTISAIEVQIEHFDAERSLTNLLLEEPVLSKSIEPDMQACIEGTDILRNSETSSTPEGVASGICAQSLQERNLDIVWEEQSDAILETTNFDGQQSSFSATGALPPTRHAVPEPITDEGASTPANGQPLKDQIGEKSDNLEEDLFEAPSFMTLVDAGRQPVSNEIQSEQNPQPESHGSRRHEEAIEKPRIPLRNLLMEANLESKQKAANGTRGRNGASLHKNDKSIHPSRVTSGEHGNSASFNRGDQKGWNSPARLPSSKSEKRKVKGRHGWVPFICCPSID